MSAPVRVMLIGSAGRMGQAIIEVSQQDSNIEIVSQCDCGDSFAGGFKDCQVAIDFSTPDITEEICRLASEHRCALVIGTTGHSAAQKRSVEAAAVSVPVVFASNFSVGVNALFWLTGKTAKVLGPEFEVQIVETHHQMKKDAPSGTAKTLAEIVKKVRPDAAEIPIQSIREGDVVGEHTVGFSGPGERLELVHHAYSRATFAKGALLAAQWVVDKPPSLYTMQNVLGL